MNIIAVDGVPCCPPKEGIGLLRKETARKIRTLRAADEDFEFYPTTPEILEAMKKDIWAYLRSHEDDYADRNRDRVHIHTDWEGSKQKERLDIHSFLDIGAGDGRVLDYLDKEQGSSHCHKYGIEIARAQADDLIRRGVFIIGRDYWDVDLSDQYYSLIFSNPPFSQLERWVNKILYECNFSILYLVMPIRWKNLTDIKKELERYEATIVGEFDFSEADREARGRVNLVRINAPWHKEEGIGNKKNKYTGHQQSVEDAFERWVREYIAEFPEEENTPWQVEEEQALALRNSPIDQLLIDYEQEKQNLAEAFRAIGKLEPAIIKLMGQDKNSMLEIIRKAIEGLKSKYWRAAFDKLEPVRKRMIRKTRERIFEKIKEFISLDFNADNIYSIAIWIINNTNVGILDQIGEVFDEMTTAEYIEQYKSNKHWTKSDWRHTHSSYKYDKLPARWKLGLDYRIVIATYNYDRYASQHHTLVDDFIIICSNLGFEISPNCEPDYKQHQSEQEFYTLDGELAFTMRYYTGNRNAHLKINKKLLMKFNIEVAKIRKWMSEPDDVVQEYGVPKDEAVKMWNSGVALLGSSDVQMLEYKAG